MWTVMIILGMGIGYGVGMWMTDKWINNNHSDIDTDKK